MDYRLWIMDEIRSGNSIGARKLSEAFKKP
jgi:hypothetical protein